jgi:hypothetical protein
MESTATNELHKPSGRQCCMAKASEQSKQFRIRICGNYCVSKVQPEESTTARDRARLLVLNRWLSADRWMNLIDKARRIDALAADRDWKRLKQDPFAEIPPEISDDFCLACAQLHDELISHGIKPIPAIASLAGTSLDVVSLWLYLAERRGFLTVS